MAEPSSETPFEYLDHLVTVPVSVDGHEATFVFDTGIGLTLVSERLARTVGCEPSGATFTGRRMSGQEVTVPLAAAPPMALGAVERHDGFVGILDLGDAGQARGGVDGFLSLGLFEATPVTVDYPRRRIVVESSGSRAEREENGTSVAIRLERDGPSIVVFLGLDVPGARIEVEVDMGSDALILDEGLAAVVGVDLDDPGVRRVEGEDETGHRYTRSFTRLAGVVSVPGAPQIAQRRPPVMFQRIVHDGLVGDSFLRSFTVTYDLPGERMIFGRSSL